MKRILIGGAALALAVTGVGIGSAAPGSPEGGNGSVACLDGTVTWDPTSIWPPNHKSQTINISYASGEDDLNYDTAAVTIGMVTHDQFLEDGTEMGGSGNTLVDGGGTGNTASADEDTGEAATTTAWVLQERSGQDKTGRTYTIDVTCSEYTGGAPGVPVLTSDSETVQINVTVPHDQRRIKDDSGS